MSGPAPVSPTQLPFAAGLLTMAKGKVKKFRFQVQDAGTGLFTDVSTWTKFWFMAKNQPTDPDTAAVINKTLGAGITLLLGQPGLLEVLVQAADTSGLADVGVRLYAEVQGLDGAGLAWNLWQGRLDILPAVVQASS